MFQLRVFCFILAAGVVAAPAALAQPEGSARKILFVSNRAGGDQYSIYAMNEDGSDPTRLGSEETMEFDPVYSPDGTQIAFSAIEDPANTRSAAIYIMKADGTGRRKITEGREMAIAPAWSPDGTQIAFGTVVVAPNNPPTMKVCVVGVDGEGRREIGDGLMPRWSPDGQKLAFTLPGARGEPSLQVVDAEGGEPTEFVGGRAMMGAWSPDGTKFACIADGGNDQPDIFVMNADGSEKVQVTKTAGIEFSPTWSSDGTRIYFVRLPGGQNQDNTHIYSIAIDGSEETQLTEDSGVNLLPGGAMMMLMRGGGQAPGRAEGKASGN